MSNELFIFPTREKKPLTARGFHDAQPESSWTGEESDQWGAPTGAKNGFFVVDVDNKPDELDPQKRTGVQYHLDEKTNWGDGLIVPTPSGGYHVYYKYNEATVAEIKTTARVLCGTDVRNNGGYVCLYSQIDTSALHEIPAGVLGLLRSSGQRQRATTSRAGDSAVQAEIAEGGRNAYLAKAAGRMQKIGVLSLAALQEVNERDCNPPLDNYEVEAVFHSIARYAPESLPSEDDEPQKKIVWASEMVSGMFEFLRDKGKTQGESTGLKALDELLGGKRLGELTVTMAEAKSGKNTFYHFQQCHSLDKGIPIGYASRELSPETEVLPNLISLKLGKSIYKYPVTEEEVIAAIVDWKLAFAPGYGQFDGNELFDWMEECMRHGIQYFYIDHLHYCLQDAEDYKLLAEFGRKLKTFTKTNQVHIDLIVQPKVRPSYKVGDKMQKADMDINMLRGGASLGQVLDNLITMDRVTDKEGNLTDFSKIDLKRARSKLSKTGTFFMRYDHKTMSFSECPDPREELEADDTPVADRGDNKLPNWMNKNSAQYGTSKSGEFFDLKKSVNKMLTQVRKD